MGPAVEALLFMLDQAFDGDGEHSLLANLASVSGEAWSRPCPGGARTVAGVVYHVASAKLMYRDYAFGVARLLWDDTALVGWLGAERRGMEAWLGEAHRDWRASVAAVEDTDLDALRRAHWGEQRPLRKLVAKMIGHDLYHAGEINHLRALLAEDDRWPGQ